MGDGATKYSVNAANPESSVSFHTVQAAIDAAANGNQPRVTISIAPGRYVERVKIPRSNTAITLAGTGKKPDDVWIGEGFIPKGGPFGTIEVNGDNAVLENLTIENTAGATAGPQMAVYVGGKRDRFENVQIKGWQDTLGVWNWAVSYFHKCRIEGSVDFIYSGGTALFDNCDIVEIRDIGGPVAAPSTPADVKYGLVFKDCHLKTAPGVVGMSLMRPWYPDGMTAYINCAMDNVSPQGWDPWDGREKTCRAFEYGSVDVTGKPIDLSKRSPWAKILTDAQAAEFTAPTILGGWDPEHGPAAVAMRGSK
jgi:pectinesterase